MSKFQLTFAFYFFLDDFFVFVEFFVCHGIEWIFRVGRLVDGGVVLVVALDNALGSRAHQHYVVPGLRHCCVLHFPGFFPSHTFQNV